MELQQAPSFKDDKLGELSQTLNGMGQKILIIDLQGRILFVTRDAGRLLGWNTQELHDREISEIVLKPSIMESINGHHERLKTGESWLGHFLVKKGDGGSEWCDIAIATIPDSAQELFYLTFSDTDQIKVNQLTSLNQILMKIDTLLRDTEDYEPKLTDLAQLFIPDIADSCGIFLIQSDGTIEPAAIAPEEIAKNQAVYDWLHNDLLNDDMDGLPEVIHTGKAKLVTEVSPVRRVAEAGINSYMIIPLVIQRGMIGAITFINISPERHLDQSTLAVAENLAIHIAVFLEKTHLQNESQKLKSELEKRVTERTAELSEAVAQLKQSDEMLQTLFRVSNKLNATLDVDLILDELALEAIKIVGGESGFAGLRTPEGMTVHKYFAQGVAIEFEHTWPIGEGIPGWVMKYKVPYGTSDAANDPLIRHELPINADVRSIICTPILDTVGEVIGYFDIRNKQGADGFSINDQEMLLTLAPVASIAIQNALTYQQRMVNVAELKESARQLQELAASLESAREEERTQIARELHDQLGQALTGMKFDLAWLTEQLEKTDNALAQKAKDITAQMNTMIKTVRRIATELRPGMLDDLGLVASIEWQAHDFEKRTGINCTVNAHLEGMSLTRDQNLALYRIFQEALTNAARYANAKNIDVNLSLTGEVLTLEVHDDGRGIRENEITGFHSLGLIGMRERAKHMGGTFSVQGEPGHGTSLKVSIPINQKA